MYTIYHNPRCTKSREALAFLEEKGGKLEIVRYLDEPLTYDVLRDLLDKLDISAEALLRKNESEWKENFKDKELDEDEIIFAMIEYPKLMQRPIVVKGEKAVVARPAEEIEKLGN